MNTENLDFFQDHMSENVCFGCGILNDQGLQIKSRWQGEESICEWTPQPHHHGWSNLLNGGIMATIIDCHCMGTAMAYAYRSEGRSLDSLPEYRYATGSMNIKFIKPTSNLAPVKLVARVIEEKGRKITLTCSLYSEDAETVTAEVIAIRVFDSSVNSPENVFKS